MKATELKARLDAAFAAGTIIRNSVAGRVAMELTGLYTKKDRFGRPEPIRTYMVFQQGTFAFIRPCKTSGSGRFTKNADYTADICAALDILGIEYTSGNDSPRGGKTGNFIKLITYITKED